MPYETELPEAPTTETKQVIDDTMDASMFEGVGKVGDTIPKGTYHFRLDQFTEEWSPLKDKNGNIIEGNDKITIDDKDMYVVLEPYFACRWVCQEEPLVGRIAFDNVSWIRPQDIAAAKKGDPSAKALLQDRLVRANSIMKAAGFTPDGTKGFKHFLSTHPEMKLTITESPKKMFNKISNKWEPDPSGEKRNNIVKYLSLHRVA